MFGDNLELILRAPDGGENTLTIDDRVSALQGPDSFLSRAGITLAKAAKSRFVLASNDCEFAELKYETLLVARLLLHQHSVMKCFIDENNASQTLARLTLAIGDPYQMRGFLWRRREVAILEQASLTKEESLTSFYEIWLNQPPYSSLKFW